MRTATLLAGLTMLAFLPAFAQEVTAHFPPPDGFDALHASDAERAYYGFPRRPAQTGASGAAAYAKWATAMAAARHYVSPEIRVRAHRHGPERAAFGSSPAVRQELRAATQVTSSNWTGQYLQNSVINFGSGSFDQILGLWLLPSVQQAVGSCSGTDVSATWVGLDGANGASHDVLQAGTESDVTCTNGVSTPDTYPWFEWYPDYTYEITNFPLSAGSSVFVSVQATSAATGQAMFVNLQTGNYTTEPISPPAGTSLTGNTAEWIMERPTLADNQPGSLADFGVVMMCYEQAQAANISGSVSPGSPGAGQGSYLVTMYNSNGANIAQTAAMGPTGQAFSVQGPTK